MYVQGVPIITVAGHMSETVYPRATGKTCLYQSGQEKMLESF